MAWKTCWIVTAFESVSRYRHAKNYLRDLLLEASKDRLASAHTFYGGILSAGACHGRILSAEHVLGEYYHQNMP
jgi:hypothetical protein